MFGNRAAGGSGKRPRGLFARLLGDRRGATAIVVAMMSTSVIGVTGLAVDVGDWYGTQRALQTAADAAATAGTVEMNNNGNAAAVTAAINEAGQVNLTGLAAGGVISIPQQENEGLGKTEQVQVTASKTANLFLSGLFLGSAPKINASSTSVVCSSGSCYSPPTTILVNGGNSGCGSLTVGSGSTVTATNGAVVSNTSCGNTNSGTVHTKVFCSPDGAHNASSGQLAECQGVNNTASNTLGGNPPSPSTSNCSGNGWNHQSNHSSGCYSGGYQSSCDYNNVSYSDGKSHTLSAGEYCGGITVSKGSTVTLNPGIYVINNGGLSVNSSGSSTDCSTLTNTTSGGDGSGGVSIFFTGTSTSSNNGTLATLTPSSCGKVSLTAPTSGSMQGVVTATDSSSQMCNGQPMTSTIGGSGTVDLSGTVNMGEHALTIAGSAAVNSNADYTIINAASVNVTNTSTVYAKAPSSTSNVPSGYVFNVPTIQTVSN